MTVHLCSRCHHSGKAHCGLPSTCRLCQCECYEPQDPTKLPPPPAQWHVGLRPDGTFTIAHGSEAVAELTSKDARFVASRLKLLLAADRRRQKRENDEYS